jgi:hypothetical protein
MQETDEAKEEKFFKKFQGYQLTLEVIGNGFIMDTGNKKTFVKDYETVLQNIKDLIAY